MFSLVSISHNYTPEQAKSQPRVFGVELDWEIKKT